MRIYKNYVNGKWVHALREEAFEERNPANLNELIGLFSSSQKEDIEAAINSSNDTFFKWSIKTPYERSNYLKDVLEFLKQERISLSAIITCENGKTLKESLGEIDAAISEMEFQIHQGLRLFGNTIPANRNSVLGLTLKVPLGVVAVITPWNFPLNVALRKMIPALMAGNTVILKPASLTSLTAVKLIELFEKASIPSGTVNLVLGSGSLIGKALSTSSRIHGLSFTGSTEVGLQIQAHAARNLLPTQLELGGKNPAIILKDADLEEASNAVITGAFSCAGQWCTSTSRVVVEKDIYEEFIQILKRKVEDITVGRGDREQTQMGPVCGERQLETVLDYIHIGLKEGATLVCGGNQITDREYSNGCYVAPTIFKDVKQTMRIAKEEIFGPVLCIMSCNDFEEAITVANNTPYGLSSSIFTKNISNAMKFINLTKAGLTHVNMPTAYKEPHLPFGGMKMSGIGIPEAGKTGIDFFTKNKSIYLNWN